MAQDNNRDASRDTQKNDSNKATHSGRDTSGNQGSSPDSNRDSSSSDMNNG